MLLLSSKTVSAAKKMMSLVSGRAGTDAAASSSSLSLRAKKNKRKLYRPEISSPIDMPAHPVSLTAFSANMSVSAQTYFLFTQSSEERLFSLTSADPGLFPASEWALYSLNIPNTVGSKSYFALFEIRTQMWWKCRPSALIQRVLH